MNHRNTTLGSLLLAVLLAAGMGFAGQATAQSTDGSITGTAKAGETIILRGDMGVTREIRIEKDGKFSARRLPVGTYEVLRVAPDGSVQSQTATVLVNRATPVK